MTDWSVGCVRRFDISAFAERGPLAQLCSYGRAAPIWQHEHTVLSEPFNLLELDFAAEPPATLSTPPDGALVSAAAVEASAASRGDGSVSANALVVWIDYADAGGGWPSALSTGPESCSGAPTAWSQGVRFLETPLALPTGAATAAAGGRQQQQQQQQAGRDTIASVHAQLDTLGGGLKLEVLPVR
jgi:hypothetical protein